MSAPELVPGPGALSVLPDGSLVDAARFGDRYSRLSGEVDVAERDAADLRTETERDRDRLQYSPYLRRLAGVTQVISPDLNASQLHSRASHSHKVAVTAREIAEHLIRRAHTNSAVGVSTRQIIEAEGGLDIAACEAAGLAHDIGHPPFGHAGEEALDAAWFERTPDGAVPPNEGFEGNAQSLRTVLRLDGDHINRTFGLDLTFVTLAGVLKYPWVRAEPFQDEANRKFGAYRSDETAFRSIRRRVTGSETGRRQTLEASVMDLADDIAYAIHDLEDFIVAGVIDPLVIARLVRDATTVATAHGHDPQNPFLTSEKIWKDPRFSREVYLGTLNTIGGLDLQAGRLDTAAGYAQLRTELSGYVAKLFACIEVGPGADGDAALVRLSVEGWHLMQTLKMIAREWVVTTSRLGFLQRAQRRALHDLAIGMADWLDERPPETSLPPKLVDCLRAAGVRYDPDADMHVDEYRAITDYLSSLSDSEAMLRSRWMDGSAYPGTESIGVRM